MASLNQTKPPSSLGRRIVWAVVACALAAAAASAVVVSVGETGAQGAVAVRQAVIDSAMQCAAVEGAYPSSLKYLEDHYGLVVNHDDYAITYEIFAANVAPSVVVVPR